VSAQPPARLLARLPSASPGRACIYSTWKEPTEAPCRKYSTQNTMYDMVLHTVRPGPLYVRAVFFLYVPFFLTDIAICTIVHAQSRIHDKRRGGLTAAFLGCLVCDSLYRSGPNARWRGGGQNS